ncbi:glyoxalase [Sphingobacterium spiritivorum]|uniref:glyoxalase n=1 Tax=Sphingobacterium spiritivorum TaxID=258 RepID=UPI001917EF1B|nr:glyoxalase [Sphingobacterium spiritivorum]QQT25196.1 glyoxalase [Sphingobacterium spiritivorum]
MLHQSHNIFQSGVFISFAGNCKEALTYYQSCFGGQLKFQMMEQHLEGFEKVPVISGSLISDSVSIYGSDLIPDEGRQTGNYLAVFLLCNNAQSRTLLLEKLMPAFTSSWTKDEETKSLIEVTDRYDVRWLLAV